MKIGPLEPKVPVTPLAGERAGAAAPPKAGVPAGGAAAAVTGKLPLDAGPQAADHCAVPSARRPPP